MRATVAAIEPLIELKFGQVGIANLRLNQNDPDALRAEIEQKVSSAPQLFGRAPVVLDLSRLAQLPDAMQTQALLEAVRAGGMLPVGLSYSTTENELLAKQLNLPLFAKFRAVYERSSGDDAPKDVATPAPPPAPKVRAAKAVEEETPITVPQALATLRHAKPVRSGQQVYARGRDLIVNSTVANGAEVI